jgi:hypothetical protein
MLRDIPLFLQSLFGEFLFIAGAVLTVTPFVDKYLENSTSKYERFRLFVRGCIKNLRWIGLFCILFACYQAWDIEHKNLEQAINGPDGKIAAWSNYTRCDAERSSLRELTDTYSSQLENQRGIITNQQSTIDTCMVTLTKNIVGEPLRPLVWTVGLGIIKTPILTEMVLVTNRQTTLRGDLECDEPFDIFDWTLASGGIRMGVMDTKLSPRDYYLQTSSPLWEPRVPIIVNTTSNSTLHGCKFTPRQ